MPSKSDSRTPTAVRRGFWHRKYVVISVTKIRVSITSTERIRGLHIDDEPDFTGILLTDGEGTPTRLVGIGRDLTERRQRERRLQALVEESNDVISIIEADGVYQYQSPPLESILGHDPEETVGDEVWEYIHPEDRETVREEFETWVHNPDTETEIIEYRARHVDGSWRWMEAHGSDQFNNTAVGGYLINSRDITKRKQERQRLEEREQTLRELHAATREFYPPADDTEVAEFLEGFLSSAFEFPYVSVKKFDEEGNCLSPAVRSSAFTAETETPGRIEPGPNPIWRAYEQGERQTFDMQQHAGILDSTDPSVDQGLAFPVGDFGVIIVCASDDDQIDEVARELLEVVAANAESAFERLRDAETVADIATERSTQQDKVEELTAITETLQALHEDLQAKETTDGLDGSVCDSLTRTARIDLAWIGRPECVETNLQAAAWAGQESGYLTEVPLDECEVPLPAQRVVSDHEQCSLPDIGARATEADWAKHASTAGFRSVLGVPLVYDGVLYGVLSAYSTEENAFDRTYSDLVTNAGSLLVSYGRTLAHRYEGSQQECTTLEFELSDPSYPFHRLAATTDCRIRVDIVVETTDTALQLLVTVLDGDPESVVEEPSSVASISEADRFGDASAQLSVSVQRPFLASVIGKHDAVLVDAVSDSDGTRFRVRLPRDTPKRPVLDSLLSEYQDISPVAQRQTTEPDTLGTTRTEEILTDRQGEVLRAAFHGGYYETPKEVTGDDIGAELGISNTAVYNHLQAATSRILEATLASESESQT
jgi:PAS domain S-box-containing protein